jgi:hypothetical protein
MAEQSKTSKDLWLLRSANDFREHSTKMLSGCCRRCFILTENLDAAVYANADFVSALSTLARSGAQVEIKILVKNFKPAIDAGHPLIKLAQRLRSKIQLKKIAQEPENTDMGFMICDTRGLIYKNDETVYQGFANYKAAPEIKKLQDEFIYLWERADIEKELDLLHI